MTIKLPSLFEEIAPSLPNLQNLLNFAVNPQNQQQQALKDAMLKDPSLAQKLVDMGPDAVTKVYGKGTGGMVPTTMPVSSTSLVDKARGSAVSNIMKLGPGNAAYDEFIAGLTNTDTPQQRETKAADLLLKQSDVKNLPLKTKVLENTAAQGTQNLVAGQQGIDLTANKLEDKKKADAAKASYFLRNKSDVLGSNTWNAHKAGKFAPGELDALLTDESFKNKYEKDYLDNHFQAELAIRQQIADRERKGLSAKDLYDQLVTRKAVDVGFKDNVDPQAVISLMKNRGTYDEYSAKTEPPTDPAQLTIWKAAQALKKQEQLDGTKEMLTKHKEFRITTQKDFDKISSSTTGGKAVPESERIAALQRINEASRSFFGTDAPQYKYDAAGPGGAERSMTHWSPAEKVLYRVGGDPNIFGSDEPSVAKPPDHVDAVAQDIIAGKLKEGEMLAQGTPDERTKLSARLKELRAGGGEPATSVTPTAMAKSDSTIKAGMSGSTPSLNVGRDLTDSISTANKPSPKMSQLIDYMTKGMNPADKAKAIAAILAMSQTQKDAVIKNLQESGKL